MDPKASALSLFSCFNRAGLILGRTSSWKDQNSLAVRHLFLSTSPLFMRDDPPKALTAPDPESARRWVWHSTLESRKQGKWSVLAVVETLAAVALYWWIAIHFDTHLHLLTSVFVAPLLLLRSPQSIEKGVDWFLNAKRGITEYRERTKFGKSVTLVCALFIGAVIGELATRSLFYPAPGSRQRVRSIEEVISLVPLILIFKIGLSITMAFAVMVSVNCVEAIQVIRAAENAGADGLVTTVSRSVARKVIEMQTEKDAKLLAERENLIALSLFRSGKKKSRRALAGAAIRTIKHFVLSQFFLGMGIAFSIRSLSVRIFATVRHPAAGLLRLPENWRESHLQIDSSIPPELLPGIREKTAVFTWDGIQNTAIKENDSFVRWSTLPFISLAMFLPAFLYRLNIKATAWFWWPLAYLLKPPPPGNTPSSQQQALCWPITDTPKCCLILLSGLWLLASLLLAGLSAPAVLKYFRWDGVPGWCKLILAVEWSSLRPWHWASLVNAATGLTMIYLAGDARSNMRNNNWPAYARHWPVRIKCMTALFRVRRLATILLLGFGLGALLVYEGTALAWLNLPPRWVDGLREFYKTPG